MLSLTVIAASHSSATEGRPSCARARATGACACPEGGATLAAARRLVADGRVAPSDRVVLYNTGSGLKYLEAWESALDAA